MFLRLCSFLRMPAKLTFFCGGFIGFVLVHMNLKFSTYQTLALFTFNGLRNSLPIKVDISIVNSDDVAKQLSSKVQVLCWIMTQPKNLELKTKHVRATWAKHCNMVLYMSSNASDFPTVGLNVSEGRDNLYMKTIQALHYIHTHHLDSAEWFLKADDDTFVVVENLRRLLSGYNTDEPVYLGHRFGMFVTQGYMSGGAGYVLSREAIRRFVQGFSSGQCTHTSPLEDVALGMCMETMKVKAGDSRDELLRETFNPFTPESHLIPPATEEHIWSYDYYKRKRGPEYCSDFAISFHYIQPEMMYELEYYTHHLRPFGYQYRFTPGVSANVTESQEITNKTETINSTVI
ncbi:glycoprotein-N-acetylgalactosamine 3-beta-galactosyltransferase 1 [Tachysurus fulvidraco]|uniref:glycoprotein-N-acetylgalactosamine 3-beta-galactosyltransferase 1 n=1 Tax=Tachysurus fulvidraco TaxID=1234273 RepID=UPI000F4F9576|nr:glycoprotein-N-acetylgalactosamine 3-beta-galactosyltransferase 1 [Tachysurus fulvidraco]